MCKLIFILSSVLKPYFGTSGKFVEKYGFQIGRSVIYKMTTFNLLMR